MHVIVHFDGTLQAVGRGRDRELGGLPAFKHQLGRPLLNNPDDLGVQSLAWAVSRCASLPRGRALFKLALGPHLFRLEHERRAANTGNEYSRALCATRPRLWIVFTARVAEKLCKRRAPGAWVVHAEQAAPHDGQAVVGRFIFGAHAEANVIGRRLCAEL